MYSTQSGRNITQSTFRLGGEVKQKQLLPDKDYF